ncbi:hypothetical protein [uncultured Herbaspirillum sp.]|uniref:hypothetical protein n=1 Tax=uncultured Herbaspirillum sp. TaxID=160236 RepID=UPI002587E2B4|nr:hypothetical protein [uncultured Herbaspirillum sp.]
MNKKILHHLSLLLMSTLAYATACAADMQETRVLALSGKCPVSQAASVEFAPIIVALLAAVAPSVIEKGIDLAAGAASAAGADKTVSSATSSYQGNFYASSDGTLHLHKSLACIVITRGRFGDKESRPAGGWGQNGFGTIARKTGMQGNPDLYLEMTIDVSPDRSSFRLLPQYLYFAKPLEESSWRSPARGLTVSLSFSNSGTDKPFASTMLAFPTLTPPFESKYIYLSGYQSNWMALPVPSNRTTTLMKDETDYQAQIKKNVDDLAPAAPKRTSDATDVSLEEAQKVLCELLKAEKKDDVSCPRNIAGQRALISRLSKDVEDKDARWAATQTKIKLEQWNKEYAQKRQAEQDSNTWVLDNLQPFNLDVTMAETQAGSAFLKFVGSVLTAAKPAVTAVANAKIAEYTPTAAANAQAASDAALLNAMEAKTAVERQLLKVTQASTDDDRNAAAVELPKLKLAANIAYRKADLPEPYPGVSP